MGPCPFRRLGDHRIGAAGQQGLHRAFIIRRIKRTIAAGGQLGHFAHHALLVDFRLRAGRIVVEYNVGRLIRVLFRVFPALHRSPNKPLHLADKLRILEVFLKHIKPVFQRRDALILIFEDDELIYTGKIGYEVNPDISTYASFTHGYKSGGFNLDSTAAIGGADPRFASEIVDAFELGMKSKLWDGRITFNVAGFLEKFENFQVLEFTGAQFQTFNVPKAQSMGVEIESSGRITDNFSFNAGLTLLEAKYPDDCAGTQTSANVTALCGNTLTNAPKVVGILGGTYEGDLTENYTYFLNASLRYEGDRRTSTQAQNVNTGAAVPFDIQAAHTKINLRAGIGGDDWSLEAWATNVTNEITRGVTFNTTLRSGSRSTFIQDPRFYGLTVRKDF